jgi:NTE family protein
VLGAAWMTGALVRLHERLPTADVDLLVGTSAGSVLAAALRCRTSLDEIVAWQAGDVTGTLSESMVLAEQDGPLPPWPQPRPGSLPLARAALFLQVPPWVGASGWLPHGRGRHVAVRSLIGALQKRHPEDAGSWADGRTWIAAMDYDTGQRVLFGRPGAPPASLADAVVASCSIPGWYEPVRTCRRCTCWRRWPAPNPIIRSSRTCASNAGSGSCSPVCCSARRGRSAHRASGSRS